MRIWCGACRADAAAPAKLSVDLQYYTLPNGLKVVPQFKAQAELRDAVFETVTVP